MIYFVLFTVWVTPVAALLKTLSAPEHAKRFREDQRVLEKFRREDVEARLRVWRRPSILLKKKGD